MSETPANTLQYRSDGPEDAPVLVLGPALGTTWHMWDRQIPELTRHWRVLRYDLPGHGGAPARPAATVAELADWLAATLDALGIDRFGYAGCCIGGAIGADLALRRPERLASLALVGSSARFGTADTWGVRSSEARSHGLDPAARAAPERWFTPAFAGAQPAIVDWAVQMVRTTDMPSYAAACEALAVFDIRPGLDRVQVPTLVLVGAEDQVTPPADARVLVAGIPDSRLAVVPNTRHLAPVEQPAAVTDLLVRHFTTAWQHHPAPPARPGAPKPASTVPPSLLNPPPGPSPAGPLGAPAMTGAPAAVPPGPQGGPGTSPMPPGPAGDGRTSPTGESSGSMASIGQGMQGPAVSGVAGPRGVGMASPPGDSSGSTGSVGSMGSAGHGMPGAMPGATGAGGADSAVPGAAGAAGQLPGLAGMAAADSPSPSLSGAAGPAGGDMAPPGDSSGSMGGSLGPGVPGPGGAPAAAVPGVTGPVGADAPAPSVDPVGPMGAPAHVMAGAAAPAGAAAHGGPGAAGAPAGAGSVPGAAPSAGAANAPGAPGGFGMPSAEAAGWPQPGAAAVPPGAFGPPPMVGEEHGHDSAAPTTVLPAYGSLPEAVEGPVGYGAAGHPARPMPAAAGGEGEDALARGARLRHELLGETPEPDRDRFGADFDDFVTRTAWGETWAGPGLDTRTRALLTLTALTVGGHLAELAPYTRVALRAGATVAEIAETLRHTALYCGLPAASAAFGIARRVIEAETGGDGAAPRPPG